MPVVEVKDGVWKAIIKRLAKVPTVKVGVFGGADKAAAHEYGSETVPERSFIRLTFQRDRHNLKTMVAKLSGAMIRGMDPNTALELLGQWGVAAIRRTITEGPLAEWPPLNPDYEAKKLAAGKTTMLVDTGEMINSVTYKLDK